MDDSTLRRLREAEQRITSLERMLAAKVERPAVTNFPRDRWLGVTVRIGSDYPTASDANTFGVKLLSAAYSPQAPGPSTVTQRERGTTVIARTWPSRYVAEGTQVVVDRLRGVPEGGEWWIAGSSSEYVPPADILGTTAVPSGHFYQTGSYTPDYDGNGPVIGAAGLWVFPGIVGQVGNSLGLSVRRRTPISYESEWLELLQSSRYIVTIYTSWSLASLSLSDARTLFRAGGHEHAYTDNGGAMTTGTATPDARGLDDGGIVNVSTTLRYTNVNAGSGDIGMGMSTLRPFYSASGGSHWASHASVYLINTTYFQHTLRIKVQRNDSTPYAVARIGEIRVHIRQCDPATAGPSA